MYKIKNITEEKLLFVDSKGKKTMVEPGKEIESELPAAFDLVEWYENKLQISGGEEKPQPKQQENKKPEEVK